MEGQQTEGNLGRPINDKQPKPADRQGLPHQPGYADSNATQFPSKSIIIQAPSYVNWVQ